MFIVLGVCDTEKGHRFSRCFCFVFLFKICVVYFNSWANREPTSEFLNISHFVVLYYKGNLTKKIVNGLKRSETESKSHVASRRIALIFTYNQWVCPS